MFITENFLLKTETANGDEYVIHDDRAVLEFFA